MIVMPLAVDHLRVLDPALSLAECEGLVTGCKHAYVALHEGQAVAAAGIIEVHARRAIAWALFAPGQRSKWVHRYVRDFIDACRYRRVEMLVAANDPVAVTWAERLGFQREGLMREALPKGSDAFMYARLSHG